MKNKYFSLVLIAFIGFLAITVNYYLTNEYKITYIEKNNITKSNRLRNQFETLLPVGYFEFDEGTEHWGYIDTYGDVAISLTYDSANYFDENFLAIVEKNNKFGLITTTDEKILDVAYKKIQYMGLGIYYYQNNSQGHLVKYNPDTKQLSLLKDVTYDEVGYFTDTIAYVVSNNKLGYIDQTGKVVIDLKYDFIDDFDFNFYNDFAFFYKNGKFGIINTNGFEVFKAQLDEVINDYILKLDYKEVYYAGYDMVPYRKGNLWGYMNRNGSIVIEPQYLEAYPFTNNSHARVKVADDYYNFIKTNGDILNDRKYLEANDFYRGFAMVSYGEREEGLIDLIGNTRIQYDFDYVGSVNQNRILIIDGGYSKYYHINNFDDVISINYRLGDEFTDCGVVFASDESGEDKTYVILDFEGQRIYNEIMSIYYQQFEYKQNTYISFVAYEEESNLEYFTYLNENGELLWKVYKD